MDNPRQVLLHLTSRGENVRTLEPGRVGQFTNMSQQPINNINKFGLLHYSIPKVMDLVNAENRRFTIRIKYDDGAHLDIPVTLPMMDYYRMKVSIDELSTDMKTIAFAEVLQTAINWAIQKEWTASSFENLRIPVFHVGIQSSNRLGCVVKVTDDRRLQFIFGYRGAPPVVPNGDYWTYSVDGGTVQPNTGNPVPNKAEAASVLRQFPGVNVAATNLYHWIDTGATARWSNAPEHPEGPVRSVDQVMITDVEFHNLSPRLQLLFGASSSALRSQGTLKEIYINPATGVRQDPDARYVQQGRMCLVNYIAAIDDRRTGMINMEMPLEPNMFAPSFMFLALTTQGTKSKVLGHKAERGGWAVPTSANQIKSKYDNLPSIKTHGSAYSYDSLQVRQVPFLLNLMKVDREFNEKFVYLADANNNNLPPSVTFDQLPYGANAVAAINPGDNTQQVTELHNFALTTNAGFEYVNDTPENNHRLGSRMIHFGDLQYQTALAHKPPRSDKQFGTLEAPTFTVSMIDPNWLYTDVPNSTLQTIDIKLLWGDTSENVPDRAANPVQITLIASQ